MLTLVHFQFSNCHKLLTRSWNLVYVVVFKILESSIDFCYLNFLASSLDFLASLLDIFYFSCVLFG